jgi:hypothetical protein
MRKFICVLVFVMMLSFVSGLGITPGRNSISFTPGFEGSYSVTVFNSDQRDINLVVNPQGELQDYIFVKDGVISMGADEPSRDVSYDVRLPQDLGPGKHTADLFIVQLPDEYVKSGQTSIGAVVAVVSEVVVDVPYPGKYAEAKLNIKTEEDGSVSFFVAVKSLGDFDLIDTGADIQIFDPSGNEVAVVKTEKTNIASGEQKELLGAWNPDGVSTGMYRAKATVNYGEGVAEVEQEFSLGGQKVKLAGIEVNDFSLGDIAKFEIIAENVWNQDIEGVYAEMLIYSEDGNVLANVKSPTYTVSSGGREVMQAFWDTKGVVEGDYDSTLFLKYDEGGDKKDLTLQVSDDSITIIGFGYQISSLSASSGSLTTILIGVIVFLVLVNLSWFMYLRKKIKKKK